MKENRRRTPLQLGLRQLPRARRENAADAFYPSLSQNSALTGQHANNLVMAIIEGIDRKGADLEVNMPALGDDLNDQQKLPPSPIIARVTLW